MKLSIRAHFDGRYIVPDEPGSLPLNRPLKLHLEAFEPAPTDSEDAQLAAYERLRGRAIAGLNIPADELRRDPALYGRTIRCPLPLASTGAAIRRAWSPSTPPRCRDESAWHIGDLDT